MKPPRHADRRRGRPPRIAGGRPRRRSFDDARPDRRAVAEHAARSGGPRLRLLGPARRTTAAVTGDRFDFAVTEAATDVSLGAVVVSRRHRENYEVAYLAGQTGRGRGLMTRAVRLLCDCAVRRGRGAARAADASGQRAVAAARRALRLSSRRAASALDLAARSARRRDPLVSLPGRPAVTLHSLRDRALYVTPIRVALGVLWLGAARIAGAPGTGAVLAFAGGAFVIVFTLFNDPRSRFLHRGDPEAAPADASVAAPLRQALHATLPIGRSSPPPDSRSLRRTTRRSPASPAPSAPPDEERPTRDRAPAATSQQTHQPTRDTSVPTSAANRPSSSAMPEGVILGWIMTWLLPAFG